MEHRFTMHSNDEATIDRAFWSTMLGSAAFVLVIIAYAI